MKSCIVPNIEYARGLSVLYCVLGCTTGLIWYANRGAVLHGGHDLSSLLWVAVISFLMAVPTFFGIRIFIYLLLVLSGVFEICYVVGSILCAHSLWCVVSICCSVIFLFPAWLGLKSLDPKESGESEDRPADSDKT